jgi:hypothetical protein
MWQKVPGEPRCFLTERLSVPGGWIVRSSFVDPRDSFADSCVHQIFIEDKEHDWVI